MEIGILVFIGSDLEDPENLNAEIELWLENDRLVLTKTCIVFIPAGIAHGRMEVKTPHRTGRVFDTSLVDRRKKVAGGTIHGICVVQNSQ